MHVKYFLSVASAYEVIKLKGYTNWAIGTMVATLCHCIFKNQKNVYPLSTMVQVRAGCRRDHLNPMFSSHTRI